MPSFPIFLSLVGRACLVVGGGAVGCDKARRLAAAGASVLVIDPHPSPSLVALAASDSAVAVEARCFEDRDCEGRLLVFACTGDEEVDDVVARSAAAHRALCGRADGRDADFTTAATLTRGDVCVAVSTSGSSPLLAIAARDEIAARIGDEYGVAAEMLASLRRRLHLDVADSASRRGAMKDVLAGDLLALLRDGRRADAEMLLERVHADARRTQGSPCTR